MKAGNKESRKMNRNLFAILSGDRQLRAIFSGIVLTTVALLGVAVAAGVWYF